MEMLVAAELGTNRDKFKTNRGHEDKPGWTMTNYKESVVTSVDVIGLATN
jgi:hypothetical protein